MDQFNEALKVLKHVTYGIVFLLINSICAVFLYFNNVCDMYSTIILYISVTISIIIITRFPLFDHLEHMKMDII